MKRWINDLKKKFLTKEKSMPFAFSCGNEGELSLRRFDVFSKEGYQQNVIVYRCINLIARSLSSVPWLLYEKKGQHEHEVSYHPLLTLLNSPSPRQARSAFLEALVSYFYLSGNAYVEAILGEEGTPILLYPLRPDTVRVIPGPLVGVPEGYEINEYGKKRFIEVDLLQSTPFLHMKLFHPLNTWYGLSPLEAAARAIDQHNAVAGHNLALLQNGGRPSGALMIKPKENGLHLTESQRQSLRHDLKNAYEGGTNAGRLLVLEGDFDWKEMGLSPKDLDYVEGKNLSAREICQAFGIPPMLAGVPGDATFANYKEARLHLWEDTILPLLEFFVAEFNLWLTPYFGNNLRLGFDLDSIPALAPKREALWQKIKDADFLTQNEKRQAVGYGPLSE